MAAFVLSLLLFSAFTAYSSANYCVCKDGVGDSILQKNIDYACGNGADCSAILQNGACFNPNTIKDHCNYAVNSYYQRKGASSGATCDFTGSATLSANPPSSSSGCTYQSTPGNTGGGTTTTTPGTTAPGTTSPGAGTGTGTGTGTGIGTGTGTTNPVFGLGPTGSGFANNPDGSGTETLHQSSVVFTILLIASLVCLRV